MSCRFVYFGTLTTRYDGLRSMYPLVVNQPATFNSFNSFDSADSLDCLMPLRGPSSILACIAKYPLSHFNLIALIVSFSP
jgi:hypothetical protein